MGKNNNLLASCFVKNKKKIAIETNSEKITYLQLKTKSFELINFFKKQGIKKGQVISVKLPNSIELIYCYFACIFGGYIICPINNELNQAETNKIVKSVNSKYYINSIKKINFLKTSTDFFEKYNQKKIMGIFLTSGTTSLPKGICHSSENLVKNAISFNKKNKINNNRFYHIFPMNYMAGFLNSIISPIIAGGTIVLKEKFNINFAIKFFEVLSSNKINYLWLNPTMIKTINHFKKKKVKLSKKLKIFVGTAPLSLKDKKEFYKKFSIMPLESYGMTEILLFSSQENSKKFIGSNVGSILKGCKIFNNSEQKLIIKSTFMNEWNYNLETKSYEQVNKRESFDTGDLGYLDKNKNLNLFGRSKNIIIKGGQNISPENLEKKITKLKFVSEVCAVPIKDKFYGENICLLIKTQNNYKLSYRFLEQFIKINFTKLEFPKKIIHVRSILKNDNYKILRKNIITNLKSNNKNIIYEKNY